MCCCFRGGRLRGTCGRHTGAAPLAHNLLAHACRREDRRRLDTLVSINDQDQVLLMAGHHDWTVWDGKRSVQLQFEDLPET